MKLLRVITINVSDKMKLSGVLLVILFFTDVYFDVVI